MSRSDGERWDRRYSDGDYNPSREPAKFLTESLPIIPVGRALVLACGTGRNALQLAAAGFQVDGLDVSPVAIGRARTEGERRGVEVNWRVVDLDQAELEPNTYDLITMFRYMNKPLWTRIADALAPNGWLMMELHLRTSREVAGPQCDEYRLAPQELLDVFADLRIVRYEECFEGSASAGDASALARLLACNGDPGW